MKNATANVGLGCAIVFALPFAAIGAGALVALASAAASGQPPQRLFLYGCVGVAFALTGFGLIAAALAGRKRVLADGELQRQHPNEPWMWNPEWASGRISDQSRTATAALWAFAILWNAIASPSLVFLPAELAKGNYAILLALVFPLVGAGLLAAAVRATLRAMRFRRSTLVLDTVPAPLGGELRGRVEVDYAPLADAASVVVRLSAVNRRSTGKSTTETIVWQEEYELPRGSLLRTMNGVAIPIEIDIPHDAPQSRPEMPQMLWRLTIDAELPGIDYSATFVVPVFRTAATQPRPALPHTRPAEPREPEGFRIEQTVAGRALRFPPFRAKGLALTTLLISVVWCGVVVVLFFTDAPRFFAVLFALFALPLLYTAADLLFGSSVVVLGSDKVEVRRRMLWSSSQKTFRRIEIDTAKVKIGTQSGSRPYYDVELQTKVGKKVPVAKYLRSKREAEWVAAQIHGR
jgi:hypothetical protein